MNIIELAKLTNTDKVHVTNWIIEQHAKSIKEPVLRDLEHINALKSRKLKPWNERVKGFVLELSRLGLKLDMPFSAFIAFNSGSKSDRTNEDG